MAKRIVPAPRTPAAVGKDIISDYRNADHAMYFDGAFIGARSTRQDAERDLDAYAYDLLEAEAVTSADLAADALLPFEPSVAELREALSLETVSSGHRDNLNAALPSIVHLDLDCTVAAIDQARKERPSKALESAWQWLSERTSVTFDATGALIVDSATWSNTRYHVTTVCGCPARKPCWHLEARALVDAAIQSAEIDAAYAEQWA